MLTKLKLVFKTQKNKNNAEKYEIGNKTCTCYAQPSDMHWN